MTTNITSCQATGSGSSHDIVVVFHLTNNPKVESLIWFPKPEKIEAIKRASVDQQTLSPLNPPPWKWGKHGANTGKNLKSGF